MLVLEPSYRKYCIYIFPHRSPKVCGSYTGNRPDAKPEDYGSRAIDLEQFLTVLAEGIEEHNTRVGRRSEVAWGRSFAEVFDTSYSKAPMDIARAVRREIERMADNAGSALHDGGAYAD